VNDSPFGQQLLVAETPKFMMNQPDLFQEIIHILQRLSNDRETKMRFDVVKAINKTTELNLSVLQHSTLFDILKRGICDKNVSILNTNCVFVL
jgi:hypothetical protein